MKTLQVIVQKAGKGVSAHLPEVDGYVISRPTFEKLKKDIRDKGLRYKTTNAAGKEIEKSNESIINITKVTSLMLKILSELKLNEPLIHPPSKQTVTEKRKTSEEDIDDLLS